MGIDDLPLVMKYSLNEKIAHGDIYRELSKRDDDYIYFGESHFSIFAEYPYQVRDGGGGSLLLIRDYNGRIYQGEKIAPEAYALRIVRIVYDLGRDCWEAVDFDINYNMKRNEEILWSVKG